MSFFGFRKNGKSRGRIRDRFLGRISENPSKDDQSTPPITPPSTPPLQRKFISPEDFVRFDGRLKGLIVDEKGLDVIYWRRLLDLEQETLSGRKSDFRVNRDEIKEEEEDEEDDDDDGEEIDEIYRRRSGGSPRSDQIGEIPSRPGNAERRQETRGFDSKESFNFFPSSSRNFSPFDENPERQSSIPPRPIEPLPQTSQPPIRPLPQTTQRIEPLQSPIGPPQPPIPAKQGPNPPPPPPPGKKSAGPPPPPSSSKAGPPSKPPIRDSENAEEGSSSGGNQMKLKPLHWDKVNPDMEHSMVWHQMDRGSFNFNGDLMEALFGYVATPKKPTEANKQNAVATSSAQTYILDPRKSQNTAIVLKSLNMTKEEIIDVLSEGQDVDSETLERLSRIAPTREEQAEIFEFTGDATKLADAESFLFHILRAVPSAFTRLNVMLFKLNFNPEIVQHEESLETLEKACKELRSQGLFLKLLEAVLKAGNRMNAGTARGNAQAFNLSALRKLSDVKSIDGKTTLLHFVVEEVVRSEGKRQALSKNAVKNENSNASREEQEKEFVKLGLPVIRGLSAEFSNVKKAAAIDYEAFSGLVSGLTARAKDTLRILDQSGEEVQDGFRRKMKGFLESAEEELQKVRDEEIIVMEFVRRTTEYYQSGAMNDKNQFQLFVIIKDFLSMVDKVCGEIAKNEQKKKETAAVTAASSSGTSSVAPRYAVRFPILPPNFMSENSRDSSSESDSDS